MERIKFLDLKPIGHVAGRINVAYDRVFNSGTYIGGKEVEAFENEWAEYCDAKYCAGVGNGFDALVLACSYMAEEYKPIKPGISVPWKTCLPTWAAAKTSCSPFYPDLTDIIQGLYLAVHIYGRITLSKVYEKDKLIEDCAQCHGAKLDGIPAGKFGKIACWSFYPTKNLGAMGDAGAITTDDINIYEYVKDLRSYGTRADRGINSRLDPLQAAILRAKLPYLNEWNIRRSDNALTYLETIIPNKVKLPSIEEGSEPCWHIFAIETDDRDDLRKFLLDNNVETMIHYPEVPYPSYWKIPEAESWTKRTLSLPVAPHVTSYICKQIGDLINQWQSR